MPELALDDLKRLLDLRADPGLDVFSLSSTEPMGLCLSNALRKPGRMATCQLTAIPRGRSRHGKGSVSRLRYCACNGFRVSRSYLRLQLS